MYKKYLLLNKFDNFSDKDIYFIKKVIMTEIIVE